jgi:hypothetical protein
MENLMQHDMINEINKVAFVGNTEDKSHAQYTLYLQSRPVIDMYALNDHETHSHEIFIAKPGDNMLHATGVFAYCVPDGNGGHRISSTSINLAMIPNLVTWMADLFVPREI